ncbi:hypothetical protein MNEG_7428 [Monoraphidium neglectum]|uniref:Uncharacterized protein n=1 Tax=Monoraphidium neglectum TaxID=145388 RepID=A0A0D2MIQ8_9CHLO|nr:hypothetical protein MNEG_7428 [Monoraphidium neglectum]KIZ00532.1 hypothetical protein MNEG_7428 [Monoraphidium neglectum]|eukprot:XP_013899551.1 hypothetical protein MNEG_7428 [Monoraphidium neglectum]
MIARLALWCAVLAVGASCLPAARAQDDSAAKARAAVEAFCASPAFKKLSCAYNGVMGADEDAATTADISPFSGTMWAILPKPSELPKAINARDSYDQYWSSLVSLACKGDAVVRSVFKYTKFDDTRRPASSNNCAFASLDTEWADAKDIVKTTPIVRCELELPAGPEPEAVRATRAKEGRCWQCTACGGGGGCPAKKGQWYSDSTVYKGLKGCDIDLSKGYSPIRASIHVNPGTSFELAKFEICNGASCFNPATEAAKLKAAKACVKGVC